MENFKFTIFTIIILVVVLFVGYWAFSTIESGSDHLSNQEIKSLKQENELLKEQNKDLQSQVEALSEKVKTEEADASNVEEPVINEEKTETTESNTVPSKYQTLISEIEKLIKDNVSMKKGSQGTRVGTVQKFLNVYNNTSNKIDNDYGAGTEIAIKKFQTEQGLTSDGEAGPGTFRKMVEWLKAQ